MSLLLLLTPATPRLYLRKVSFDGKEQGRLSSGPGPASFKPSSPALINLLDFISFSHLIPTSAKVLLLPRSCV